MDFKRTEELGICVSNLEARQVEVDEFYVSEVAAAVASHWDALVRADQLARFDAIKPGEVAELTWFPHTLKVACQEDGRLLMFEGPERGYVTNKERELMRYAIRGGAQVTVSRAGDTETGGDA